MNKEKEIEEMAKELHCATNESFISCRKIARILVEKRGYHLCGSDNCPNFKHYQEECDRCVKTMEVKKSLEIESVEQRVAKDILTLLQKWQDRETPMSADIQEIAKKYGVEIDE